MEVTKMRRNSSYPMGTTMCKESEGPAGSTPGVVSVDTSMIGVGGSSDA